MPLKRMTTLREVLKKARAGRIIKFAARFVDHRIDILGDCLPIGRAISCSDMVSERSKYPMHGFDAKKIIIRMCIGAEAWRTSF